MPMVSGAPGAPADLRRVQLLGGTLYLFKYSVISYANKLVISAHGGACKSPANFALLAGERLLFYSLHGQEAPARSLNYATGRLNRGEGAIGSAEDVTGPGNCRNYILQKYQGVHATSGETYDMLQKLQDPGADTAMKMFRNPHNLRKKSADGTIEPSQYLREVPLPEVRNGGPFDILTIRNRWYSGSVTLEEAMKEIRKLGHQYLEIHCSFCRA